MEKQRWEEAEKRKAEERRSEKRKEDEKNQRRERKKKEDQRAKRCLADRFRAVSAQLPEMAWGFHCDFHNDLWSCALPPEAESLLDRSFSLEDMIRSKATGNCAEELPPLNGSMVLLGTGSETLTKMLASTGLSFHDHHCNAHTLLEHGAGHVIVSLRHPVSRIVSGMQGLIQMHNKVHNKFSSSAKAVLNSSNMSISEAIRARRAAGASDDAEQSDRGKLSHFAAYAYSLQQEALMLKCCAVSVPGQV
eukprot:s1828_g11.t1